MNQLYTCELDRDRREENVKKNLLLSCSYLILEYKKIYCRYTAYRYLSELRNIILVGRS